MDREQSPTRRRRRASRAGAAIAGATLVFAILVPAFAHDTNFCGHYNTGGGTPSSYEIVYKGHEWVGSNHYHYYSHWTQSGSFLHNETNACSS